MELYEPEAQHVKHRRFSNMYVDPQRDSVGGLYNFTLHNGLTRNRTDVTLSGEGAETNLYGGVIADKGSMWTTIRSSTTAWGVARAASCIST